MLYPPVVKALRAAGVLPHYCVNITGHGWRKLMRHAADFTYRMHALPAVPEVLAFMQREGRMEAREAYGSLNMGAGFALFVAPADVAATIAAARATGLAAWACGTVEPGPRRVLIEPLGHRVRGRRTGAARLDVRPGASTAVRTGRGSWRIG